MEKTLQVLNDLEREGVLGRYAIGGAMAAIAVQTGRSKDRQRVRLFVDEAEFDKTLLESILARHGLGDGWRRWTC